MKRWVCAVVVAISAAAAVPARADEVTFWNGVLLDLYRLDYGTGCPCPLARSGAIVHASMYDALMSIDKTHEPYLAYVDLRRNANRRAAVMSAAYHSMIELFPGSADELAGIYLSRRSQIAAGPGRTEGIRVGRVAARALLAARADDGSQTPEEYTFLGRPGDYEPTPPGFNPECNPEWKDVRPFCMERGDQFRSKGPLGFKRLNKLLESPGYARELNEVKRWGALNSTLRTDEQTQIAFFWANDANGTYKPLGHLFDITRVVSEQQGLDLAQNARLFAMVALAMGDAGIAAWDMKYGTAIDLWRPISAIRKADTDNNPRTTADPDWEPLNPFTPPFPAYVSGHATFAGAHSGAMAEFFGTDHITFTVDSEDPFYNSLPEHPPRTFTSFTQAAVENGISRVYLGVHFRMDAADGNAIGFRIGHLVGRNFLRPACKADFDGSGRITGADFYAFMDAYFVGSMTADIDGNGIVNQADCFEFVSVWMSGC